MTIYSWPSISIVIPTYNRPAQLQDCLEAIGQLTYPRDRFEIIVVDDGSPMPLDCITEPFAGIINLTLLRQSNRGPSAARNTGAAIARSEWLAFTDDDCAPHPEWLSTLARRAVHAPDCILGGRTINALPGNLYASTSQTIMEVVYNFYNLDPEHAQFFASNNLLVPAAGYAAVGGFDEKFRYAEDRDFCDRWQQSGRRLIYVPDAVIGHAHHLSLATFLRQHAGYGGGALHFHRARAQRGKGRFVPDLRFYFGLQWHPLRHERGWRRPAIFCLALVAQLANLIGFYRERRRTKREAKLECHVHELSSGGTETW